MTNETRIKKLHKTYGTWDTYIQSRYTDEVRLAPAPDADFSLFDIRLGKWLDDMGVDYYRVKTLVVGGLYAGGKAKMRFNDALFASAEVLIRTVGKLADWDHRDKAYWAADNAVKHGNYNSAVRHLREVWATPEGASPRVIPVIPDEADYALALEEMEMESGGY